jgi:hypothetical protein
MSGARRRSRSRSRDSDRRGREDDRRSRSPVVHHWGHGHPPPGSEQRTHEERQEAWYHAPLPLRPSAGIEAELVGAELFQCCYPDAHGEMCRGRLIRVIAPEESWTDRWHGDWSGTDYMCLDCGKEAELKLFSHVPVTSANLRRWRISSDTHVGDYVVGLSNPARNYIKAGYSQLLLAMYSSDYTRIRYGVVDKDAQLSRGNRTRRTRDSLGRPLVFIHPHEIYWSSWIPLMDLQGTEVGDALLEKWDMIPHRGRDVFRFEPTTVAATTPVAAPVFDWAILAAATATTDTATPTFVWPVPASPFTGFDWGEAAAPAREFDWGAVVAAPARGFDWVTTATEAEATTVTPDLLD